MNAKQYVTVKYTVQNLLQQSSKKITIEEIQVVSNAQLPNYLYLTRAEVVKILADLVASVKNST